MVLHNNRILTTQQTLELLNMFMMNDIKNSTQFLGYFSEHNSTARQTALVDKRTNDVW